MGLLYALALIGLFLQGVLAREEFVTDQAILRKGLAQGRVEEARRLILMARQEQWGEPSADVVGPWRA
jgi:hypothetical protein